MLQIPLAAVPSQSLTIVLNDQATDIALYQKGDAMFIDVGLLGDPIVTTRLCRNRNYLLKDARYRGYLGDFCFVDTQGDESPYYQGLADRFALLYFAPAEL